MYPSIIQHLHLISSPFKLNTSTLNHLRCITGLIPRKVSIVAPGNRHGTEHHPMSTRALRGGPHLRSGSLCPPGSWWTCGGWATGRTHCSTQSTRKYFYYYIWSSTKLRRRRCSNHHLRLLDGLTDGEGVWSRRSGLNYDEVCFANPKWKTREMGWREWVEMDSPVGCWESRIHLSLGWRCVAGQR